MTATCKVCKWWKPRLYKGEHTGVGICPHVRTDVKCNEAAFAISDKFPYIHTDKDFGCIHHQLKEDNASN